MKGAGVMALCVAALLGGCSEQPAGVVSGYAEGEYVYVAAPDGGWVTGVPVKRGMQVKTGDLLFTLDADAQTAQREQAAAQLAQAQSQLANAEKGLRPDEIAALQASLGQAKANLQLAEADLTRAKDLRTRGFVAQSVLDAKQAQRDVAAQQVKQIESNLALGRKGARPDEIAAARANVDAAKAAVERADYALSQRRIVSKVAARVEDTLRRAGEYAAPGAAVVQLLPPQNVKVRFFVPEQLRAKLSVGTQVAMRCDGCPANLKARVTFVSSDAEFTPPVIYSVGSREKLVWMVEAVPEGAVLSPGQPVDVTLP
jgi:HlyD family secretion protein